MAIGGSGADEDMMRGNTLAAIVGNRSHEELSGVEQNNTIFVTQKSSAGGILEAMEHYDFLGDCVAPAIAVSPVFSLAKYIARCITVCL